MTLDFLSRFSYFFFTSFQHRIVTGHRPAVRLPGPASRGAVSERLSILIADDHPIFRSGLRGILEKDRLLQVTGEAGDGVDTLEQLRRLRPDMLLLDLRMPRLDGLDVAATVHREGIAVHMLVLTMVEDETVFNETMEYGVHGYLLKDCADRDLLIGIHAVAQGRYFISGHFPPYRHPHFISHDENNQPRLHLDHLTPTERRVLRLVAECRRSADIAELLCISVRTVDHHRENICHKLRLSGTYALLRFALTHRDFL